MLYAEIFSYHKFLHSELPQDETLRNSVRVVLDSSHIGATEVNELCIMRTTTKVFYSSK